MSARAPLAHAYLLLPWVLLPNAHRFGTCLRAERYLGESAVHNTSTKGEIRDKIVRALALVSGCSLAGLHKTIWRKRIDFSTPVVVRNLPGALVV